MITLLTVCILVLCGAQMWESHVRRDNEEMTRLSIETTWSNFNARLAALYDRQADIEERVHKLEQRNKTPRWKKRK